MNLHALFPRLTFLTTLTAIGAYCVAEWSAALAVLALPGAAGAWWLRGRPWADLVPRIAINLVLLAIVAFAILTFLERTVTIEDFARFLVLLLVVKLFDRRAARDYAQILSLSVFLVIGSILTSVRFELGLILIPLIPMLIAAAMLHQLYAGQEAAARAFDAARGAHARRFGVRAPAPAPRQVAGPQARRHLRAVASLASLAILAVATLVFLFVPRGLGASFFGAWTEPSVGTETQFTSQVQLGRGGFISESQRVVLHLRVTDDDDVPMGGPDTVYHLRGNILDEYEGGRWTRGEAKRSLDGRIVQYPAGTEIPLGNPEGMRLVQEVSLLSSGQSQRFIFSVLRPCRVTFNDDVHVSHNPADGRVVLSGARGKLEYIVRSVVSPRRPRDEPDGGYRPPRAEFPSERIRGYTSDLLAAAGLDPEYDNRDRADDVRVLRIIEAHLRENFRYTTDIQAAPPGADPIEWFLLEHREGHCEYFASAMAAMARSAGISTRVIAGYVAAEWNDTAGHYVVREANAHAWVEAWLGLPNDWRHFDPTPEADLLAIHRPRMTLATRLRQFLDALEHAWISGVVTYDQGTRRQVVRREMRGAEDWFTRLQDATLRLRGGGLGLLGRALLVGLICFTIVALIGWAALFVVARARGVRVPWRGLFFSRLRGTVEPWAARTGFYRDLLQALELRGVAKPPWRPPAAHADAIAGADPAAGAVAARLSRLYYAARFGRHALSDAELGEATTLLASLAADPAPAGSSPARRNGAA